MDAMSMDIAIAKRQAADYPRRRALEIEKLMAQGEDSEVGLSRDEVTRLNDLVAEAHQETAAEEQAAS